MGVLAIKESPLWMIPLLRQPRPLHVLPSAYCFYALTLQGNFQEVVSILLEALLGLSEAGGGPGMAVVILLADGGQEVVVQKMGRRGQAKVPAESLQEQKFCGQQLLLGEGEVLAAQDPCIVYLLQFGHAVFPVLKLTYGEAEAELTRGN